MIARLVVPGDPCRSLDYLSQAAKSHSCRPDRQAHCGSGAGVDLRRARAQRAAGPGEPSAVALWRCCVASPGRASRFSSQAIRQIRTIPFRPSGRTLFDGLLRCCPLVRQIQGDRAREKTTPGYRMTIESPGREARRPEQAEILVPLTSSA